MYSDNPTLTIGALASKAGISVETVRFYQRKLLLEEPERPYGGIRRYGHAVVSRIHFIKAAQRLGFSLDEVAQLLQLDTGTQCRDAKILAEQKLTDVRQRLADLHRIETALITLIGSCSMSDGRVACPLIASLESQSVEA